LPRPESFRDGVDEELINRGFSPISFSESAALFLEQIYTLFKVCVRYRPGYRQLAREFVEKSGMSYAGAARLLGISASAINQILMREREIVIIKSVPIMRTQLENGFDVAVGFAGTRFHFSVEIETATGTGHR
jgi:hypothetical protein